jgi:hypothetical protein
MLWFWILLAALVLFLVWAGRRVKRHGGTQLLEKGGERVDREGGGLYRKHDGRDHPDDTRHRRSSDD